MGVRLVCLASGRGSNFAALNDGVQRGEIPGAEMVGLVVNRTDAGALKVASDRKVPSFTIDASRFRNPDGKLDRDHRRAGEDE